MNDDDRTPDAPQNPSDTTPGTPADNAAPASPASSAPYAAPHNFGYSAHDGSPQDASQRPPTQNASQPTTPQPAAAQTDHGWQRPGAPIGAPQQHAPQQHPANQQPTVQHPAPPQRSDYPMGQPTSQPGSAFGPAASSPYGAPQQGAPSPYATAQYPGTTTAPRRRIAVPVIAALAIGALLGGASGAGVTALSLHSAGTAVSSSDSKPATVTVNDNKSVNQTTAVAAKASPSVVTINVSGTSSAGTGSGVILTDDGYVLTNTHVVTLDGQTAHGQIEVTLADGTLYTADIVGTDPTDDLAVIKLKNAKNLTPIEFADSDKVNVGDQVVAIGAPLGLSNTVTDGIVSAVNRSISIASSAAPDNSDSSQGGNGQGGDSPFSFGGEPQTSTTSSISVPVIQTDASINPGNSGGALLDDEGKLVGINVAIASAGSSTGSDTQSGSIGVGFSIPSNVAKRISDEIIADGKATHGLLGASVRDATAADSATVGALIAEAPASGGAAAAAGLKRGDVVTKFDGHPITGATDLTAQVRALAGGATAKLTYVRDGQAREVTVTLGTFKS